MGFAIEGVHSAAATPIGDDGAPDLPRFVAHCKALLDEGCHGIAMLGTSGEANSFGIRQRMALFEAAVEGGIEAGVLVPGTSAPSVADTVELTRQAVAGGAKGVLMLPPFYYKGVSDAGVFRFYAEVIEKVGDDRLRIVLYHIPQMSAVPLSHDLIGRLLEAFPGIVVGIKDSSGDLANMVAMAERFPDLGVIAGADPLMLPVLQAGGAGCITAASNLRADALRVVWENWQDASKAAEVEAAQARIAEWRALCNAYALIPTIKAMLAKRRDQDGWARTAPPLVALSDAERRDVWGRMEALGG